MLKARKDELTDHYEGAGKLYTRVGEEVFNETIDYMTSGMIVPIILEGEDVVRKIRKLCGPTRLWEAPAGTIRGDFGQKDPKLPTGNQNMVS